MASTLAYLHQVPLDERDKKALLTDRNLKAYNLSAEGRSVGHILEASDEDDNGSTSKDDDENQEVPPSQVLLWKLKRHMSTLRKKWWRR